MKKLLFIIISMACINTSMGQRNIDITIDQILEPAVIKHNQIIKASFVVKNLGPDVVKIGDTLFYFAILRKDQRFTPPEFSIFTKNLTLNDTTSFSFNISPEQIVGPSFRSDLCLLVTIRNRRMSDSVRTESTSGSANNLKCMSLDYINANGWGVGIRKHDLMNESVTFYPNPVYDKMLIEFSPVETGSQPFFIYDMAGKLIQKRVIEILNPGKQSIELELGGMKNGIYFFTLTSAEFSHRKVFVVNR